MKISFQKSRGVQFLQTALFEIHSYQAQKKYGIYSKIVRGTLVVVLFFSTLYDNLLWDITISSTLIGYGYLLDRRRYVLHLAEQKKITALSRFSEFGKLSAGLFHDIINPLTAVTLAMDRVRTDQSEHEEIERAIATALRATDRMRQSMNMIRRQIGQEQTERVIIDTGTEISEMISFLRYQSIAYNVECAMIERAKVMLHGNALLFTQAMINLIANAIESHPKQSDDSPLGRVTVTIDHGIIKHAACAVITVADRGRGIPAELQPKIFESFFSTKENGIGLGLTMAKEIIENDFHGRLDFKSTAAGTCFTVTIPIRQTLDRSAIYE